MRRGGKPPEVTGPPNRASAEQAKGIFPQGGSRKVDLIKAAKTGDKRATLIALRDKLAETIQNCDSGRDMASNSKRLMEVMAEIEALPAEKPVLSKHDRLKNKHENRQPKTDILLGE